MHLTKKVTKISKGVTFLANPLHLVFNKLTIYNLCLQNCWRVCNHCLPLLLQTERHRCENKAVVAGKVGTAMAVPIIRPTMYDQS